MESSFIVRIHEDSLCITAAMTLQHEASALGLKFDHSPEGAVAEPPSEDLSLPPLDFLARRHQNGCGALRIDIGASTSTYPVAFIHCPSGKGHGSCFRTGVKRCRCERRRSVKQQRLDSSRGSFHEHLAGKRIAAEHLSKNVARAVRSRILLLGP